MEQTQTWGRWSGVVFGCGDGLYDEVGGAASAMFHVRECGLARRRALREGMQERGWSGGQRVTAAPGPPGGENWLIIPSTAVAAIGPAQEHGQDRLGHQWTFPQQAGEPSLPFVGRSVTSACFRT